MQLHSAAAREAWIAENVGPMAIDFTLGRGWYVLHWSPVIMVNAGWLETHGLGWIVREDGGLDFGEHQYSRLWEHGEYGHAVYEREHQRGP